MRSMKKINEKRQAEAKKSGNKENKDEKTKKKDSRNYS